MLAALVLAAGVEVCLAQSGFSPEGAARVTALTGQVSVLRDSVPWALNAGDTVKVQQVIVSGPDGFAVLQVSDGSTFEVYPNSRVTFRNNPASWRDLLDVWLGRVKIHIQTLTGQPNPHKVYTPTAVISVRGTVFVVEVEEDQDSTMVLVEEGQVAVQHTLLPRGDPRILNPGEWIRVLRAEPLASVSVDKGSILRAAVRALSEAFWVVATRTPQSTGPSGSPAPQGGGGGGVGLPGDREPTPPPPPPPPGEQQPAPPPPPPGG